MLPPWDLGSGAAAEEVVRDSARDRLRDRRRWLRIGALVDGARCAIDRWEGEPADPVGGRELPLETAATLLRMAARLERARRRA